MKKAHIAIGGDPRPFQVDEWPLRGSGGGHRCPYFFGNEGHVMCLSG